MREVLNLVIGSTIFSSATSESSVRGYSVNLVYCDEFSFVPNDVEFYTSTYPVISSGKTTKFIITSTPNGMNLFYKLFTDAQKGRNDFFPIKYTWECHPDRDEAWKLETIRNTSQKQFSQEHDCFFFGSSDTLIDGRHLETLLHEEPIQKDDYSFLYEKVKENHIYIVCVDVGEGIRKRLFNNTGY